MIWAGEIVTDGSCLYEAVDVVFLRLLHLVEEAEACCGDFLEVVEDDVQSELFTADAVLLAAVGFDLYADEELHLFVKTQLRHILTLADIFPLPTRIDQILIRSRPRVHRWQNSVVQAG